MKLVQQALGRTAGHGTRKTRWVLCDGDFPVYAKNGGIRMSMSKRGVALWRNHDDAQMQAEAELERHDLHMSVAEARTLAFRLKRLIAVLEKEKADV